MKKTLIQKILEGILSFFTWTNYNMMKKSDLYLYCTSLVTKIFWWLTVWDSLTHSSKIQLVIRILIFSNIIICSSAPPPHLHILIIYLLYSVFFVTNIKFATADKVCAIKGLVVCYVMWFGSMKGMGLRTCTRCVDRSGPILWSGLLSSSRIATPQSNITLKI